MFEDDWKFVSQSVANLRPSLFVEEAVKFRGVGHEADLLDTGRLLAGQAELRVVVGAEVTRVLEELELGAGTLPCRNSAVTTSATETWRRSMEV